MALIVSNMSFGYNNASNVLNGINIDVQIGSTMAIVGASGCGKSTLLRLISGILPSSNKELLKGNVSINGLEPNVYIKQGKLAFMFQEATLMPNLTVKENIALPLKIRGEKNSDKVNELIKIVGLAEFADYLPKQLSGGMKTRVSLARSFITQPELLLLDEPFSALDIAWKSKLYIELERLRERYNTTVIIVTHDVQEALLLANQVIVLSKEGNVKANYSVKSQFSIAERVNNISSFLKEVYADYMIPIQENIMNDSNRRTA